MRTDILGHIERYLESRTIEVVDADFALGKAIFIASSWRLSRARKLLGIRLESIPKIASAG
jgi:hypothetical protein